MNASNGGEWQQPEQPGCPMPWIFFDLRSPQTYPTISGQNGGNISLVVPCVSCEP
jgi:hypothetical protein